MWTFVVLLIFADRGNGICMPLLQDIEVRVFNDRPGTLWRWNRSTQEMDWLEALDETSQGICSIDYDEDLIGKEITVAGPQVPPYVIHKPDGTLTGYVGDIWTTLAETLHFRLSKQETDPQAYAKANPRSFDTWLPPTVMDGHPTARDIYSHAIATVYYGLFIMSEETRVLRSWYVRIFSTGLWTTTFVYVVAISGLLLVMYRIKRATCHRYIECNNELAFLSFNFLNVLGVVTAQGFQKIPTSWSLRLLIISAVVMGMLISCGFSSTLTSHLAISDQFSPLKSFNEFLDTRTHALCIRNDSFAENLFDESVKELRPDYSTEWITLNRKTCPDMRDPGKFASHICQPGVVYFEAVDIFTAVLNQANHRCDIKQIIDPSQTKRWTHELVMLHTRTSTHRKIIDEWLTRLRSAGILEYLERKWIRRDLSSSGENKWKYRPVEYAHIQLLTVALLIMMVVSAFICVLENIWFRLCRKIANDDNSNKHVKFFSKIPYKFPANELDWDSKRAWAASD